MKYRPDESTLISWVYGELDDAERAKVEAYFNENPEELKKLQQMEAARGVMSNIRDKEVIAPPLILDEGSQVVPIWRTSFFRASISIAASFILIIVAGRLLGPEISYSNNELRISFGAPIARTDNGIEDSLVGDNTDQGQRQNINPTQSLTQADVQEMINTSLKSSEERVDDRLVSAQLRLDKTVREAMASSPADFDSLARQMSKASEIQVRSFVTSLREENLQLMRQYLELSANDQRTYMENLLVDFSKWQQERRNQDLQILLTRVNSIESNTNQLKEETEQILASIISNSTVSEKASN